MAEDAFFLFLFRFYPLLFCFVSNKNYTKTEEFIQYLPFINKKAFRCFLLVILITAVSFFNKKILSGKPERIFSVFSFREGTVIFYIDVKAFVFCLRFFFRGVGIPEG